MSRPADAWWRERVALRYLDALDADDYQTLAHLWRAACSDPELLALLLELDQGLMDEEAGLAAEETADEALVQRLLAEHLGGHLLRQEEPTGPLTTANVAARLLEQGGPMSSEDREAGAALASLRAPLPDDLGQHSFDQWAAALPVRASRGFWRAFRKCAVLLTLGRGDQGIELAAARSAPKPPGEEGR